MTGQKLARLWRDLAALRPGAHKAREFERLARRLGRELVKRGKHPMWESMAFDELDALSIPRHGGKDIAPGTKHSILNQLEDDILAWEERLRKNENGSESDD